MTKFTRLLWSMEWETSVAYVLSNPSGQQALLQWLAANAPADKAVAEALIGHMQTGDQAQAIESARALASGAFPKFVQSKACLPLVEELIGAQTSGDMQLQDGLLWGTYQVPEDCAGWVHSFVSVAETYPACIVISDMSMPGNPMFFVNQEFCKVTGYSKAEASGRNCRFLQGPKTEPQSVAVIQDTLRRGSTAT